MYCYWWTYPCGKVGVGLSVHVKEGRGGNTGVRRKKRKSGRKRRIRIPKHFSLLELKKS